MKKKKTRANVDGILIRALCCIPCNMEKEKWYVRQKKRKICRSVRFRVRNNHCSTAKCLFKTMRNLLCQFLLLNSLFDWSNSIFYMIIMCHRYYNCNRLITPFSFVLRLMCRVFSVSLLSSKWIRQSITTSKRNQNKHIDFNRVRPRLIKIRKNRIL